jgi:hypothetical protein
LLFLFHSFNKTHNMKKFYPLLWAVLLVLYFSSASFAQVYNMPAGTNTVSTCSGFFYDSGGSGSTYGNSQDRTYTICPSVPGQAVSVRFITFDTEATFDLLRVYNGNSVAAPQFGGSPYSGTGTLNNTIFTSTSVDGCLTFRFTSDGSVVRDGWEAEIRCGCKQYDLTAVSITGCTGSSPMTFTFNGTLTHQGASGQTQIMLNGSPIGSPISYTASPMAISVSGLSYTPPAPFSIYMEDVANPSVCRSSPTVLVNAGNDINLVCGASSATLAGSGPGTWSFVSGPVTPTITTPSSATSTVTGMTSPGTYVLRRTNTVGGCTFYDDVSISRPNCITMTNTTITTCSGILLDPGGTANYPNSNTTTTTICPTAGSGNVQLIFTAFNTEENFDYVRVYDGTDVTAPLLATITGTSGVNQIVTATNPSGCLTVRFTSDGSVNYSGFEAQINCVCKIGINSVNVTACTGTPVSNYNLSINFSHGGGSSGFRVAINDVWVTGVIPYGASPQTVNLTGLSHNGVDPLIIKVVDALNGEYCFDRRVLFNAGNNKTQAVCATATSTTLTASTAGTWSLHSAPGGASVGIGAPSALTTTVTGLTVLGDYVFNRSTTIGGCTFRDQVTVSVISCLNTSSPDLSGQCTGYVASHPTYPGNYTNSYTQDIVLCPPSGSVMQITFEDIALHATDDNDLIDIFFNNSATGPIHYTLNRNDNGRTYTFASTHATGCMTIRFRTNGSNVSRGFLARISCRDQDNVLRSPSCAGAPALCMDGNNFFASGTAAGSGNSGIPLGCAATNGPSFFYFQAAQTGNLEFTITPTSMPSSAPAETGTDIDFAIWGPFSSFNTIPCRMSPPNNAAMGPPIRCNFSATSGATGLSAAGTNPSEGASGPRWSTPLPVVAGQYYVLLIDDYSRSGLGFNISSPTPDITNCSLILPVEWVSFSAEKHGENNLLKWATAVEKNNSHFEIEMSLDGEEFEVIGNVRGGIGKYSFIHEHPRSLVYYRIAQVDLDGKRNYTNIESVKRDIEFFGSLLCKPNPTKSRVELSFEMLEKSEVTLELYSTSGVLLESKTFEGEAGFNASELDLSSYVRGLYLVKVICKDGLLNAKVIKE